MIRITFPFRAISKDNEKIRNKQGMIFLSSKFKHFESIIKTVCLVNYKGEPLQGDIACNLRYYFKGKVHADTFNLPKGICDALQGVLYVNDRQIKKGTQELFEGVPESEERFEVEVYKIGELV